MAEQTKPAMPSYILPGHDQWRSAVRRFYFHLRAGDELLRDDQGQDLLDLSAARHEAELAARELLALAIRAGEEQIPEAFVIADEHGREIDTVLLAALLPRSLKYVDTRLNWSEVVNFSRGVG
jgi:hypothetical protein